LPARGLISRVHHFRKTTCPRSREETAFHSKRPKGRSENSWEQQDPGQTTLRGHSRLQKGPSKLGTRQERAFQEIKRLLTNAPVLGLPDIIQPFNLFICEKNHIPLGILIQTVGPWQWPVAYLLKHLDPVASRWPPCLWALAATVTLIREADKLTLGQDINAKAPNALKSWP
jgi:hypothetical protein